MSPGRRCLSHPTRFTFRLLAALIILELTGPGLPHSTGQSIVIQLPIEISRGQIRWDLESRVFRLLHHARASSGLTPLAAHTGLRRSARAHALDMLTHGYLSHQSRDGRSPQHRARGGEIGPLRVLGENVAYATDVDAAHTAFMSSEVHRRLILSAGVRLVGIGVAEVRPSGVIVVQDFGR